VEQGKAFYEAAQFAEAVKVLQEAVQAYKAQGDTLNKRSR
jgi:Flp pilus assembly protein TadD